MSTAHQAPASAESLLPTHGQEQGDATSRPRSTNPNRRREKPQLSCNSCRRRKLRCDRQHPSCSCCTLRGQMCTYVEKQSLEMPAKTPETATAVPSLHSRIVYLEGLVKSLVPNSQAAGDQAGTVPVHPLDSGRIHEPISHSPVDTTTEERSECGSMRLSASEVRYVGGDHWAAILESIADLKDHFDQEENLRLATSPEHVQDDDGRNPVGKPSSPHALLLYGCRRATSRAEILAALPPKSAVDRYVSRFFNRLDLVASSAVHGPTFVREYEAFWANPDSEPRILWVGLLFSMICLALLSSDATDSSSSGEAEQLQINMYREKIVQCLILGEYTNLSPYGLETLINYVYVEFMMGIDAGKDIWFLLALEVNLAMRMGYHRDPSHFPGISPLQAEMRRRLWTTVLLGDTLIAGQMGMPCMISAAQYDTAEPRNLNDDDLHEDMTELPPSRPETEHTTTLGIIARRRILVALGHVSAITASIKSPSYTEVMQVDSIFQQAIANIPPPLRVNSIAISVTDPPSIIMARLFLSHLYLKGEIMLHRRFLYMDSTSQEEDTFVYSRKACLDASLRSLEIQDVLDREVYSGGLLHTMRFRVGSLMNHHFLTATMILCSLLHRQQTLGRQEEILTALRTTRMIWMRKSSTSREAKKAAETISIVLARAIDGSVDGGDLKMDSASNSEDTHNISLVGPSTSCKTSNNSSVSRDSQGAFNELGLYSPDSFIMPSVLGTSTPLGHPGQTFEFDFNNTEMINTMQDWIITPGTNWQ